MSPGRRFKGALALPERMQLAFFAPAKGIIPPLSSRNPALSWRSEQATAAVGGPDLAQKSSDVREIPDSAGEILLYQGICCVAAQWTALQRARKRALGARRRVEVNRISITGPALFGMAALVITSVWIYLLFFVIPPVFNGTPAPTF